MMGICNNETWPRNEYTKKNCTHITDAAACVCLGREGEKCQTGILLSCGNLPDTFSLNILQCMSDRAEHIFWQIS